MVIIPFSENALASSLSNKFTSEDAIRDKTHFKYLFGYLNDSEINCKTILVEEKYVSKDFLHDCNSYYSLCHEDYSRTCKRLHFFSNTFSDEEFENLLSLERQSPLLQENYLGCIVVKPIPFTVIGFTLLKTYAETAETGRNFWGTKTYTVHLFGQVLKIKSLPFQEQDTILSACATTSIWSVLHKAADLHIGQLKTPSEITLDAGSLSNDGSRMFPNKGLDVFQICQAMLKSGLVTEIRQGDLDLPPSFDKLRIKKVISEAYLKKLVNAYSTIGIPIILIVHVPAENSEEEVTYDPHALTVVGFKQQNDPPIIPSTPNVVSWHADDIEKIYVHDDQHGPFVRLDWISEFEIETLWDIDYDRTFLSKVLIPTLPKIRIPYEDIQVIVEAIDTILTSHWYNNIKEDLVWDIKIDYSENYKYSLISLDPERFPNKTKHLKKPLPKYVWIATCFISSQPVLKFVFDATGVPRAMLGVDILSLLPPENNDKLKEFLEVNKTNAEMVDVFIDSVKKEYYEFLIENIDS